MNAAMRYAMAKAEAVEAAAGQTVVAVRRAAGFGRSELFVAEATRKVGDGFATERAESSDANMAVAKAVAAVKSRMSARKRAAGFSAEGLRDSFSHADFSLGFAAA